MNKLAFKLFKCSDIINTYIDHYNLLANMFQVNRKIVLEINKRQNYQISLCNIKTGNQNVKLNLLKV